MDQPTDGRFPERRAKYLEMPIKVCCECEAAQSKLIIVERMQAAVVGADQEISVLIDQWRKIARKT